MGPEEEEIGTVFATGRTVVISLDKGSDLLSEIEQLVAANDMAFCRLSAIGSLSAARLTYYDQAAQEDIEIVFDEPMMLVTLSGTVLAADGETQTHAHLVLANEHGVSYGGDLSPGCVVFSCELLVQELVGPPVSRHTDLQTGLARLTFG